MKNPMEKGIWREKMGNGNTLEPRDSDAVPPVGAIQTIGYA